MADYFIDISSEFCPITFVKTKLMIEKMLPGDRLEVHLKGQEPLNNVPRSVRELGHIILSVEKLGEDRHRLWIEKA